MSEIKLQQKCNEEIQTNLLAIDEQFYLALPIRQRLHIATVARITVMSSGLPPRTIQKDNY